MPGDDQRGELHIEHVDRAVLDALSAGFFPFPNPDGIDLLDHPLRQIAIDGVDGNGDDDRVPVVWAFPEDVYVRYVLPGINVKRSDWSEAPQRQRPRHSGLRYREPAAGAEPVVVERPDGSMVEGHDAYVERPHRTPYDLTYDIEVRARYERDAQRIERHVRTTLRDRGFLEVDDTQGAPTRFTVLGDPPQKADEYADLLRRHHGYILSYTVKVAIDEFPEREVTPALGPPDTSLSS